MNRYRSSYNLIKKDNHAICITIEGNTNNIQREPTQNTKVNQERLVAKSRQFSGRVNGFSGTCGNVLLKVIVKFQWSNAVMK